MKKHGPYRVLQAGYFQLRRYGHTRVSWTQKLHFGLIENGHYVHPFSDRDVAAFEAPFGWRDLGGGKANRRLLETAEALEPDLIILGHCDIISNTTLTKLREKLPETRLVHCYNDALYVPENLRKIEGRMPMVDAVFVSTHPEELIRRIGVQDTPAFYLPNPVHGAIERFDVSQKATTATDLLFCSHGNTRTNRLRLVEQLSRQLPSDVRFQIHGCFGNPPVWGKDYDRALSESKMGLNLNRQEGDRWCSSARIAQLVGNGLLTFCHDSSRQQELFAEETLVYFHELEDLREQIVEYARDDAKRRARAARTRAFYHAEFNARLCAQYIVETALGLEYSHPYRWNTAETGRRE